MDINEQDAPDLERRSFLKRAGVVAGATVWATPTVQSITSAAFAAGSPAVCDTYIGFKIEVINDSSGSFVAPSDDNNGDCQPDMCDSPDFTVPAGNSSGTVQGFTFSVVATDQAASITINAPAGGSIDSINVKGKTGGGPAGPNTCIDPGPTSVTGAQFVRLDFTRPGRGAGLSNFAGCICVTLPKP